MAEIHVMIDHHTDKTLEETTSVVATKTFVEEADTGVNQDHQLEKEILEKEILSQVQDHQRQMMTDAINAKISTLCKTLCRKKG